ncbi:MAG: ABC transporter ATP-binding protein [Desulfurococcus sp.]|nr:ABC transporter ATP-binding protein [Desulfurococcus sp.]
MREETIVAEGLVKRYATRERRGLLRSVKRVVEALRGVSFKVYRGEVVGLLGPNGAGKTTTVKILSTLLLPDEGDAWIHGSHVVRDAGRVREIIGVMLTVEKGFYGKLTGRENLEYFAALYGLPRSRARERIESLLKLLELDKLGASDRLFEEYSLGMKARLSLARALLRDPPVLLLDEPTLGLDPPSSRRIRELVRSLAHEEGKTILYTTHNMFEAEIVCDRILLINKGRIVAEGSPSELKSMIPRLKTIILTLRGDGGSVERIIEGLNPGRYEVNSSEGVYSVKLHVEKPEEVVDSLLRKVIAAGFEIISLRVEEPTLEDVFMYFAENAG